MSFLKDLCNKRRLACEEMPAAPHLSWSCLRGPGVSVLCSGYSLMSQSKPQNLQPSQADHGLSRPAAAASQIICIAACTSGSRTLPDHQHLVQPAKYSIFKTCFFTEVTIPLEIIKFDAMAFEMLRQGFLHTTLTFGQEQAQTLV